VLPISLIARAQFSLSLYENDREMGTFVKQQFNQQAFDTTAARRSALEKDADRDRLAIDSH
jgi:hypothetical protein